jgi:hypothetical protein
VRAGLMELPGMNRVEYDPQLDRFIADYDPAEVEVPAIFAAVFRAGKKMGQEYLPRLVE